MWSSGVDFFFCAYFVMVTNFTLILALDKFHKLVSIHLSWFAMPLGCKYTACKFSLIGISLTTFWIGGPLPSVIRWLNLWF